MSEPQLSTVFVPRSAKEDRPIELAMQRLWVVGKILPVGARLLVQHTFRSAEKKPLEVIYSFGLPRDAALRRFRITGEGFSVSSDLKPVEAAVKDYEEGLAEGHTAALMRQYGDGIVNLTVGNIRPGEEVKVNLEVLAGVETRDDGLRFRFPFTLAPAYHGKAKAAEVKPGVGEIELPADEFGDVILPQFAADAGALHQVGFDLTVDMARPIVETGSPSHAVRAVALGMNRSRVSLATAKDVPDRDLVLDVRTGASEAGVLSGAGKDGKGHFAAVLPSSFFKPEAGQEKEEPRRVVFVLDRSGSMQGAAIEQARKAVEACLGALGEGDHFGIVAFDNAVECFGSGLFEATMGNREKAGDFLARIDARGGTELGAGLGAAVKMLDGGMSREGGGDILVVTDGQVMGTERIMSEARSGGIRVHCLGIGAASQDRFLNLLARGTGGTSRFLTPRERVDLGAVELFASIGRPVAADFEAGVEGFAEASVLPDPPKSVFAGTPVVLFGETSGPGAGRIVLAWNGPGGKRTGAQPLAVVGTSGGDGETLRLLRGARLIADLEARMVGQGGEPARGILKRREEDRIRTRLVALSQAYGLVSRPMALVAVVERAGDKPGDLPVTRVVPVGFPQDMEWGGYFGGPIARGLGLTDSVFMRRETMDAALSAPSNMVLRQKIDSRELAKTIGVDAQAPLPLIALALKIRPDGGLYGDTEEKRVLATIAALLAFLAEGHSETAGTFRLHVKRLIEFLEKSTVRPEIVKQVIERVRSGRPVEGEWLELAVKPGLDTWEEIEAALKI